MPESPITSGRAERLTAVARYLPVEADALAWGLHVVDCGFTEIGPGSPYPPGPHPVGYDFSWRRGRTLSEFQVVYITRGGGLFESASAGTSAVAAGQVFLLWPGEWHRYRPDPATGWDETWIGFDGVYARQLMPRFFSVAGPLLSVGLNAELLAQMRGLPALMAAAGPGYQQVLAGRTVEVLARLRALALSAVPGGQRLEQQVHAARCHLLTHAEEDVDLPRLAATLGLSYPRFRAAFRASTGTSAHQYQLQVRLNKATELLRATELPVAEVAQRVGFNSVYYFSRLFKRKLGLTPSECRAQGRLP